MKKKLKNEIKEKNIMLRKLNERYKKIKNISQKAKILKLNLQEIKEDDRRDLDKKLDESLRQ